MCAACWRMGGPQALGCVPPIFTLVGRMLQPETERFNIMVKVP